MADQQAKDNKIRLVLIILVVVVVIGLVGYLVIGNSDPEPDQPAVQTTPAEDGAPVDEGANTETGQTVTPVDQAETDPILIEAQAIIDKLKAIDQNLQVAAETCDQTAIDSAKLASDGILARLETLSVAVTNPTPAHDDMLNQVNAQLEANAITELGLLTQCSDLFQS